MDKDRFHRPIAPVVGRALLIFECTYSVHVATPNRAYLLIANDNDHTICGGKIISQTRSDYAGRWFR